MSSPAEALQLVLAALDRLEIHYMIGGSVASSVHGVGRLTMDVDLVVELSKLRWYQEGGGHSQRQLEDVAGILQVQGGARFHPNR